MPYEFDYIVEYDNNFKTIYSDLVLMNIGIGGTSLLFFSTMPYFCVSKEGKSQIKVKRVCLCNICMSIDISKAMVSDIQGAIEQYTKQSQSIDNIKQKFPPSIMYQ